MRLFWQLLAIAVVSFVGGQALYAVEDEPWLMLPVGLVAAVLALFVYRWVVRRTERRAVTELAWEGAAYKTGLGTLTGTAMFGFVIVNIAFLGFYRVDGMGDPGGAAGLLGFMAAAAVTEELLYRGVLFRFVEGWAGTGIALALTGIVFGAVHLVNPGASVVGALSIAVSAGLMLGAAYVATRNLWVPIGIHFGWNFAAGGVFSTEVSGNGTPQGLLDASTSGPALVSGGAFGPEASLYTPLAGLIITAVLLWIAKRRGNLVPMRRKNRAEAVATLAQ
ncbi:CPBP family intramembrane glutamic endopeptidase [Salininema proteolyticum]|uniref:CPBP family intramembrane glutamic endopeptidase n=1 Tax=Salininema proteolyticum TaxID=1607685 RepID=A0ABV8TY77_9ACTN